MPVAAERRLVPSGSPAAVAASASGRRSLSDLWKMSRALSDPSFDVVIFPTVYSYVPVWSRARKLVGAHDVTGERYPDLVLAPGLPRLSWRAKLRFGYAQADALLTVSEYSRRGILEHLRFPEDRVFVAGEASDRFSGAFRAPARRPGSIGSASRPARSRSSTSADSVATRTSMSWWRCFPVWSASTSACNSSWWARPDSEIFLSCYSEVREQVVALGLGERVAFTGYLPDEDLAVLLNRSAVLVLPSMAEGLGLPPLRRPPAVARSL